MRIIGYIDHPEMKITVFKMDTRLSVKFERGYLEQIFKFRQQNGLEHLAGVRKLVDDSFIRQVEVQFRSMEKLHQTALINHFPPQPDDEFDEII